jgi:hypothetical protein
VSSARAAAARSQAAEQYVARIEVHLVRLADGHDPLGHLFAVERLARAARSEARAMRRSEREGRTP